MDLVVINCTVPSKKIAKDIARFLFKNKLDNCVSMVDNIKYIFLLEGYLCERIEIN